MSFIAILAAGVVVAVVASVFSAHDWQFCTYSNVRWYASCCIVELNPNPGWDGCCNGGDCVCCGWDCCSCGHTFPVALFNLRINRFHAKFSIRNNFHLTLFDQMAKQCKQLLTLVHWERLIDTGLTAFVVQRERLEFSVALYALVDESVTFAIGFYRCMELLR